VPSKIETMFNLLRGMMINPSNGRLPAMRANNTHMAMRHGFLRLSKSKPSGSLHVGIGNTIVLVLLYFFYVCLSKFDILAKMIKPHAMWLVCLIFLFNLWRQVFWPNQFLNQNFKNIFSKDTVGQETDGQKLFCGPKIGWHGIKNIV